MTSRDFLAGVCVPAQSVALLVEAAGQTKTDPDALWRVLDALCGQHVGHKLFTVLRYRREQGIAERLYSSQPSAHRVGGQKRIADAPALKRMFEQGEVFHAPGARAVREHFLDADAIFSLGCESVLNLPLAFRGQPLGQINLLHEAGHFDAPRIGLAMALASFGVLGLLHRP